MDMTFKDYIIIGFPLGSLMFYAGVNWFLLKRVDSTVLKLETLIDKVVEKLTKHEVKLVEHDKDIEYIREIIPDRRKNPSRRK